MYHTIDSAIPLATAALLDDVVRKMREQFGVAFPALS